MIYAKRTRGLTLANLHEHYLRDEKTNCWNWTRAKFACGYGAKTISGKQFYAHRLSYELHGGRIPRGKVVMHSCDNRACINPAHLSLGTQRANLRDARTKGRLLNYTNQPKGEQHHRAKMTEFDVRNARAMHALGVSNRELARVCGVNNKTMACAIDGRTWSHVQ